MLLDGMSLTFAKVSHKLKLTSLWVSSGCYRSTIIYCNALSGYLVHLPKVGVVYRRDKYKLRIYSDRGQCPASRGEGKTVSLDFLLKDATFSSP